MPMTPIMKAYVGTAKAVPDSRTPRRFMPISTTTTMTDRVSSWPRSAGTAETTLATPEVVETATVST